MTERLELPRLTRDMSGSMIEARRRDDATYALTFAASSEAEVERWYGTEILRHDEQSVRMQRINSGAAPLLFNHNWDDPVGMLDGGRIDGGRLVVDAHLFDTARAREMRAMLDGGLRNVSIGYEVRVYEEDTKQQRYTAIDWEPLEVSVVTIPADPSVGIGRSGDQQVKPVRIVRAGHNPAALPAASAQKGAIMQEQAAAAGATADIQVRDNGAEERLRIKALQALGRDHKIQEDVVEGWIDDGVTANDAAGRVLDIIKERSKTGARPATELGLTKRETERFSVFRAINAVREKNWTKAGFELECTREIAKRLGRQIPESNFFVPMDVQAEARIDPRAQQQRDVFVGTASAGGYLVETQNVSFIELLRNRSVCMAMGATRLTGLQGNVAIPKQTAAATANWLANETATATETQQTFGQLLLVPKTIAGYVEISRLLSLQASPNAESLVMADLAQVVGLAVDSAGISGSGAAGQPTGITNTASIGAFTGTTLGFAGLIDAQADVATANVVPRAGGYVTTPAVAALLMQRQRFTSTDTPLWEGNLWDGRVVGFRGMSSNQMAAATMLFGDWAQLVIAEWGVLEIEVNPYANFQAGISGVRAMYTVDVGVRYAGAFSLASSIT